MESNEKIKKALQCRSNLWYCVLHDCTYYRNKISMCSQDVARDALDYIQHLENRIGELTEKVAQLEATQPRWISVDDILPDKGSEVLVCDKGGVIGVGYYTGTWYSCNTPYRITHWMPLPEAPKEDIKNERFD